MPLLIDAGSPDPLMKVAELEGEADGQAGRPMANRFEGEANNGYRHGFAIGSFHLAKEKLLNNRFGIR